MSDQMYRINEDYHDKSKFRGIRNAISCGLLVPVEAYQKHEVCICLMSEGFDPQPPQRIHNNWCTYIEPKGDRL